MVVSMVLVVCDVVPVAVGAKDVEEGMSAYVLLQPLVDLSVSLVLREASIAEALEEALELWAS